MAGQEMLDIQLVNKIREAVESGAKALDLHDAGLEDLGALIIAEALRGSQNLEDLNLEENKITEQGALVLADALSSCPNLRILNIGDNEIGNEGAKHLCDCLPSLVSMNINCNKINDQVTEQLFAILRQKDNLKRLDIGVEVTQTRALWIIGNSIGDQSASSLARYIKATKSLEHLELDANDFTGAGAGYIFDAMTKNSSIKHLNLHCNNLDDTIVEAIYESLCENCEYELNIADNDFSGEKLNSLKERLMKSIGSRTAQITFSTD